MSEVMPSPNRLRRSVLYVPADNLRAIEKSLTLAADCIIYDLEDAVAPEEKAQARENLRKHFSDHPVSKKERGIRINGLDTEWGTEDLMCARFCQVDAIVLSKVGLPQQILDAAFALEETDAPAFMQIFAMIESAQGVLNIAEIAELGKVAHARLACLMVGINDLVKETRISNSDARAIAHSWIMQIILAARAGKLDVIDAVYNDFRDLEGFETECRQGCAMGFDGKSLIHPAQIDLANELFGPSEAEIAEASAIVDAFSKPENTNKGVIQLNGKMVERLHLEQAEALLEKVALIARVTG